MDAQVRESLHEPLPLAAPTERASMMARDPAPETPKMAHDSLVTVRLSEPDLIVLDSPIATSTIDTNQTTPTKDPVDNRPDTPISRKSSLLVDDKDDKDEKDDSLDDESKTLIKENVVDTEALRSSSATMPPPILTTRSLQDELADDGNLSDDQDEVNWAQLEQKEDEQTKDEETDNVGSGTLNCRDLEANSCSQLHCCWPDLNRKMQSWLRTQKASKSKASTVLLLNVVQLAGLDRLQWHSFARWSRDQRPLLYDIRCYRHLP